MLKIGTDIVAIERVEQALKRFGRRFPDRYLSPDEYDAARTSAASLAGYWAAKEAIAKALGCGIGSSLAFHDIRLAKDPHGAPFFSLSTDASRRFPLRQSSLSISHDGGFAIAVAVVELEAENSGGKAGR
jgi:holo-[acyl-carrier protein] synthase